MNRHCNENGPIGKSMTKQKFDNDKVCTHDVYICHDNKTHKSHDIIRQNSHKCV